MKYNEMLNQKMLRKLLNTSFKSPTINKAIWMFYISAKDIYEFLANEVSKTKGDEKYLNELLQQEMDSKLPPLNLTFADFEDENCQYSDDKKLWLNPIEINAIIEWCNKWKKKEQD
jgi:hypothetical protein